MPSVDPARPVNERTIAQPRVVADSRNVTLEALRALAHPSRMRIAALIAARGPVCVCHLEADLGYSQAAISKHVGTLRRAGLLESRLGRGGPRRQGPVGRGLRPPPAGQAGCGSVGWDYIHTHHNIGYRLEPERRDDR